MPSRYISFTGASRRRRSATINTLPPDMELLDNFEIESDGVLMTRGGLLDWNATDPGTGYNVYGVGALLEVPGFNIHYSYALVYNVATTDHYIWSSNNLFGAWTVTAVKAGSGMSMSYAWGIDSAGKPRMYMFTGPRVYSGALELPSNAGGTHCSENTVIGCYNDGTAPAAMGGASWTQAICGEYHIGRLFVGTVKVGTSYYTNRIWYTTAGTDNTWDTYFDIPAPGSGVVAEDNILSNSTLFGIPYITNMMVYQDNLIITIGPYLYALIGTDPDNWYLRSLGHADGEASVGTMAIVSGLLFWVGPRGVYQWNGNYIENILVRDHLSFAMANTNLTGRGGIADDQSDCYIASRGGSLWTYYPKERRWTTSSFPINYYLGTRNSIRSYGRTTYFVYPATGNVGRIYRSHDGVYTDDGVAITATVQTGQIALGAVDGQVTNAAHLISVEVDAIPDASTNYDLILTISTDSTVQATNTLQIVADANRIPQGYGWGAPVRYMFELPNHTTAYWHQFKITSATSGVRAQIAGFLVTYDVERRD